MTFGTILREARERKGYDLAQAARRLRIRPDILRAIEEDDFARMPPRGYARNMVNAYARLVGLNPTEMTRMYLDEAYAYQVGRARDGQSARFDAGASARGASSSRPARPRERAAQRQEERPPRQNALGRTMYDDRRDFSARSGAGEGRLYDESRTHPSRHAALPNAQYTNFYAGPKAPNPVQSKLPFIIAGAVILVLLVIVLALVFGGKGGEATDDAPKVHVSGLTDPTQTEGGEGSEGAAQEPVTPPKAVAPAKAVLEYEVASGQTAYIETYVGESNELDFSQEVEGPAKETFDVDTTLTLYTPNPDAVTLTVDGEAVELTDDDGDGLWSYTVDFPAILEQWKADHPDTAA
ncbi:helix-turn-helix domain-containing protein [Arabiibacter massiliensis]|uniref:helix-turn-helix domain-containing protein n=1 Tax=Arabiibacter massiliensis TaxID=1870985 RepID=UPI0009BB0262|nr:helix-turn-helix transcriptional regulator [Arabiibacter massiliensis]